MDLSIVQEVDVSQFTPLRIEVALAGDVDIHQVVVEVDAKSIVAFEFTSVVKSEYWRYIMT